MITVTADHAVRTGTAARTRATARITMAIRAEDGTADVTAKKITTAAAGHTEAAVAEEDKQKCCEETRDSDPGFFLFILSSGSQQRSNKSF